MAFLLSRKLFLVLIFKLCYCSCIHSQDSTTAERYERAFRDIKEAFDNSIPTNLKKINFLVENTYLGNQLDYVKYDESIGVLVKMALEWMKSNPIQNYKFKDSLDYQKNFAIYSILKDSIRMIDSAGNALVHIPYSYDFNDMFGNHEWSNMFITKLFSTGKGNCHSLPYLYKILADELGAKCWLAFAPNHLYIKNRCVKIGWYNTELTSGSFPIDAWITASGYIPIKAVQNGIYMDTLSNQQVLALCVLDLAKGYEFKTRNYEDGFILKCCDLVLKYHSINVQALLLKAETLKQVYEKRKRQNDYLTEVTYKEMEMLYLNLFELGYREMPPKMYMQWLMSLESEKGKYSNENLPNR